jgi:hypothetical protein
MNSYQNRQSLTEDGKVSAANQKREWKEETANKRRAEKQVANEEAEFG